MGLDLYQTETVFRKEMDHCFEILNGLLDYDSKEILYPFSRSNRSYKSYSSDIDQTEIAQPLLFVFEYALAQLLMKWGITPSNMIGHSIGEYVAACLAGVFSLEDALKMVVLRGKLMQQVPGGSMLSVSLAEEELKPLLSSNKKISLAAVNSPNHCVVSGPHKAVEAFARLLNQRGYQNKPLHTSHAFHSQMMEPVLDRFRAQMNLEQITLNQPKIPYISNLTGKIITAEEAVSPAYWIKHLRQTVRFSDGLKELLKEEKSIFLEVGPGRTLSTFVKRHLSKNKEKNTHLKPLVVNLVRHPQEKVADHYLLLKRKKAAHLLTRLPL
jgi:acyl transferase domain-containing protein